MIVDMLLTFVQLPNINELFGVLYLSLSLSLSLSHTHSLTLSHKHRWSLGVTLVELVTGKKPFKKKFQKYKNTDDKVKICKAGQIEDEIEEKNVNAKLKEAAEIDDDGRDSNDEETDDEEEEQQAAKQKRRSSVRCLI